MKAEVVAMDAEHLDMEAIQKAGKILKEGGLVAFPTETVYGTWRQRPGSESIHEDLCGEGQTFR